MRSEMTKTGSGLPPKGSPKHGSASRSATNGKPSQNINVMAWVRAQKLPGSLPIGTKNVVIPLKTQCLCFAKVVKDRRRALVWPILIRVHGF